MLTPTLTHAGDIVSSKKKKSQVLLAAPVHRALVLPQFLQMTSPILTVSFGGTNEPRRLVCSSEGNILILQVIISSGETALQLPSHSNGLGILYVLKLI